MKGITRGEFLNKASVVAGASYPVIVKYCGALSALSTVAPSVLLG